MTMWIDADERIRARIKANIINVARVRMIIYLLMILLVTVISSVVLFQDASITSVLLVCLLMVFVAIGLIAVIYIYYSYIKENSKLIDDAAFMTVGRVITRIGDSFKMIVKVPGDKTTFKIDCDRDFYRNATADSRVLILAVSKKNEDQMIGFDPSTYDKDGIF